MFPHAYRALNVKPLLLSDCNKAWHVSTSFSDGTPQYQISGIVQRSQNCCRQGPPPHTHTHTHTFRETVDANQQNCQKAKVAHLPMHCVSTLGFKRSTRVRAGMLLENAWLPSDGRTWRSQWSFSLSVHWVTGSMLKNVECRLCHCFALFCLGLHNVFVCLTVWSQ
jgi:hypothetical protein